MATQITLPDKTKPSVTVGRKAMGPVWGCQAAWCDKVVIFGGFFVPWIEKTGENTKGINFVKKIVNFFAVVMGSCCF